VSPLVQEFDAELRRQSRALSAGLTNLDEERLKANQQRAVNQLAPEVIDENYDEKIFEQLRKWRSEQAEAQSVPAYVVLADKSLKGIAALLPKSDKELLKVSGIGPQKLEKYGDRILDIVASHSG
jgi:superfamily II DNA helicase RecQ